MEKFKTFNSLEKQYYGHRTKDRLWPDGQRLLQLNTLNDYKKLRDDEIARFGGFFDAYIGKDYGNNKVFEILSTGLEYLFYRHDFWIEDADHTRFLLGILGGVR